MYSTKVPARNRQYIFQVKKSVDGVNYLLIEETSNNRKMGKIMIFKDHMVDFLKGLGDALDYFKETESKSYSVRFIRREYGMAYQKWTSEEESKLRKMFSEGRGIKELSEIFQRKTGSIRSRLKKIGLYKN